MCWDNLSGCLVLVLYTSWEEREKINKKTKKEVCLLFIVVLSVPDYCSSMIWSAIKALWYLFWSEKKNTSFAVSLYFSFTSLSLLSLSLLLLCASENTWCSCLEESFNILVWKGTRNDWIFLSVRTKKILGLSFIYFLVCFPLFPKEKNWILILFLLFNSKNGAREKLGSTAMACLCRINGSNPFP